MDLSLGKLQQLVTVARHGSFSRAAEELNISQPALSRSIAAMEARYGFPIFNRLGHGVELTAAGTQVVAQATPLLQRMQVFDNNLRLIGAAQAGELAMGLSPLLASQLLASFSLNFFRPQMTSQLKVMIRPGEELLDALKNDIIELFFYPESYIAPDPDIDTEAIGIISSVCVVRSHHPLAGVSGLTLDDLAPYPWASSVEPPLTQGVLHPGRLLCDNYHILREVVQQSDLVCICSRDFVREQLAEGSLCAIEVNGLPLSDTTIYLAKLRGRVNSPLAVNAIRHMKHHLAKRPESH